MFMHTGRYRELALKLFGFSTPPANRFAPTSTTGTVSAMGKARHSYGSAVSEVEMPLLDPTSPAVCRLRASTGRL